MPVFTAKLSDGRTVKFEADEEPSHDEILGALDSWKPEPAAEQPAPAETKPKPTSFFQDIAGAPGEMSHAAGIMGRVLRGGTQDILNYVVGAGGRDTGQEAQAQAEFGENYQQAWLPKSEGELPIEQTIRGMATVPAFLARAGAGLTEAAPKIALMAGETMAGIPASLAAAGTFGYDEEGKFQPKSAAIAAVLPFVGKYSGELSELLATKLGVSNDAALSIVDRSGALGGASALMIADGEREIRNLPADKQHEARLDLYANVFGNAAPSLMGGGRQPKRSIDLNRGAPTTEPLPTTEVPNASQITPPATLHGNVRPLEEPASQLPVQESQPGVQPQAQGVAQEAQVPLTGTSRMEAKLAELKARKAAGGEDQAALDADEVGKRIQSVADATGDQLKQVFPGGTSGKGSAYELGESITTIDQLDQLRDAALKQRPGDKIGSVMLRSFSREAVERATKTGSGGYGMEKDALLDYTKNPEVAKWLVENGPKLKIPETALEPVKASLAPKPAAAVPVEAVPSKPTVQTILGPDAVESTLSRWIDALEKPPGVVSDPLFVQTIGRPVARAALIVAREAYRAGKSVAKAVESGLEHLRSTLGKFDESEAKKWLASVMPSKSEATQRAAGERSGLKEVLSTAQKTGMAGRKAGEVAKAEELAPVISDLREKLTDSVSKIKALGQYFTGQERGAKAGGAAARAEAEHIDRWLSADVDNIRDSLLKLTGGLPIGERGRFLSSITAALKRPGLFAGNVTVGGKTSPQRISAIDAMYRSAAKVAAKIENRIDEVRRNQLVETIRGFGKFTDSGRVDVPYRQRIKTELENFERLHKAGYLSDDAMQAAHDRLVSLRDIGRSEQNVKEALWNWQKEFATTRLESQPTRPVETRPELRPQPGDKTPLSMRMRNWVNKARNGAAIMDKALMPIDALFDLMESGKAQYNGWLFRHARGPVDLGYNEATVRRNQLLSGFDKFVKESNLTAANGERIGVYAQNLQEGGRQRLIDAGLSPEAIDRILASLSPAERKAYDMMRATMDSQLPAVQDVMRRLYNTEVKPEKDYFPMPRDWRVFDQPPAEAKAPGVEAAYDELATWKALREDLTPRATHTTSKGFTLERQAGAKTPIRIDAFDIFRQHINDTAYLIEMQPVLKQLGELGRGDLFREKYGNVGRTIFLDWLDTVARQGGVENFKRWKLLDTVRKNSSVGIIGFRLSSQIVHESNVPYIVARIGPWFGTGMRETITDRGQAFLDRNFAETRQRGGGEPAQVEAEKSGVSIAGIPLVSRGVVRASYSIARGLDRFNSQASVLGGYLKALKDKGADWQRYDELPIDRQAQQMALVLARRSIASPLAKDVPQALSRGRLTGGNVSLGRSLFQFQNIFLDQWSNIRHDLYQAGIREKNPRLAATMFLAITGAVALETGIKESVKGLENWVTGYTPKPVANEFEKKAITETVRRFPFGGQIENELMYGDTGIPVIDATLIDIPKAIKSKSVLRTAGAVGQVMGVPGASQATDLLLKATK